MFGLYCKLLYIIFDIFNFYYKFSFFLLYILLFNIYNIFILRKFGENLVKICGKMAFPWKLGGPNRGLAVSKLADKYKQGLIF